MMPREHSTAKPKISQSIWEFAGDFIRMGKTLEQRQTHLNAACSAWNIACNHPGVRKKTLDNFMLSYKEYNPNAEETALTAIRSDMEHLIEVKLQMFPGDLRQIVNARIFRSGDKDRIEAAAARLQ
jgi:hypothetical protein